LVDGDEKVDKTTYVVILLLQFIVERLSEKVTF